MHCLPNFGHSWTKKVPFKLNRFSQGCREFPHSPYFFVLTLTGCWTKMHRLLHSFHLVLLKFCLKSDSQSLLRLLLCSCRGLYLHRVSFSFFRSLSLTASLLEMLASPHKTYAVLYLSCILVCLSLAVGLICMFLIHPHHYGN